MKQIISLTVLLLSLIPFAVWANEKKLSSSGTLSLYFENDTLVRSDGDYTSGMKLSWTSRWIPSHDPKLDDQEKIGETATV
jgi:hypothetical protein